MNEFITLTFRNPFYVFRWISEIKIETCDHDEWDMDTQIKVIECRKCGKRAWVKENRDLYSKKK